MTTAGDKHTRIYWVSIGAGASGNDGKCFCMGIGNYWIAVIGGAGGYGGKQPWPTAELFPTFTFSSSTRYWFTYCMWFALGRFDSKWFVRWRAYCRLYWPNSQIPWGGTGKTQTKGSANFSCLLYGALYVILFGYLGPYHSFTVLGNRSAQDNEKAGW